MKIAKQMFKNYKDIKRSLILLDLQACKLWKMNMNGSQTAAFFSNCVDRKKLDAFQHLLFRYSS